MARWRIPPGRERSPQLVRESRPVTAGSRGEPDDQPVTVNAASYPSAPRSLYATVGWLPHLSSVAWDIVFYADPPEGAARDLVSHLIHWERPAGWRHPLPRRRHPACSCNRRITSGRGLHRHINRAVSPVATTNTQAAPRARARQPVTDRGSGAFTTQKPGRESVTAASRRSATSSRRSLRRDHGSRVEPAGATFRVERR